MRLGIQESVSGSSSLPEWLPAAMQNDGKNRPGFRIVRIEADSFGAGVSIQLQYELIMTDRNFPLFSSARVGRPDIRHSHPGQWITTFDSECKLDGSSKHRKKRFASFPSPAGMSLPNSPWAGIMTS